MADNVPENDEPEEPEPDVEGHGVDEEDDGEAGLFDVNSMCY